MYPYIQTLRRYMWDVGKHAGIVVDRELDNQRLSCVSAMIRRGERLSRMLISTSQDGRRPSETQGLLNCNDKLDPLGFLSAVTPLQVEHSAHSWNRHTWIWLFADTREKPFLRCLPNWKWPQIHAEFRKRFWNSNIPRAECDPHPASFSEAWLAASHIVKRMHGTNTGSQEQHPKELALTNWIACPKVTTSRLPVPNMHSTRPLLPHWQQRRCA